MRKGFTLAEVLITLTIIGVVASLTIPSLINNIGDQQNKIAWKKAFSDISQATQRLSLDNGGNLSGAFGSDVSSHDNFRNGFLKYLNYTKLCDVNTPTGPDGCWHSANNWFKLSGTIYNVDRSDKSRLILNNGTFIIFEFRSTTCDDNRSPQSNNCGTLYLDINGNKGPNTIGKDIYAVMVLKNGNIIPRGTQNDYYYNDPSSYSCDTKTYTTSTGWNCSATYLYQ